MRLLRTLLALAACLFPAFATGVSAGVRGPYLSALSADAAVVDFHTEPSTRATLSLHREDGDNTTLSLPPSSHHHFSVHGLKPDTTYHYRISWAQEKENSPKEKTELHTFRTPAPQQKSCSFIAYGDSRDQHTAPQRHRRLAVHFSQYQPAFIVHTGDLLIGGKGQSSSLFGSDWTTNFFLPLQGVMERVPFYLAAGNHDQDAEGAVAALVEAFPRFQEGFAYAFDYGSAHITVLHCANQMKEFAAQKKWFMEDLQRAKGADWRIVVLHVSPFTNGKYRDNSWTLDGREDFLQACVDGRVDVVLSGHDHSYQRFHPLKASARDPHAVLFIVTALAGTNPYPAYPDDYTAVIKNDTDHFCVVQVNPQALVINAYDRNNQAFDHVVLTREGMPSQVRSAKIWREGL